MLRSAVRHPITASLLRHRFAAGLRRRPLSSASPASPSFDFPYFPPPNPSHSPHHPTGGRTGGSETYERRNVRAGNYEEEQIHVLHAALPHVLRLGWGEDALIAGARDAGVSPAIVGSFPRKDAALVEYFMDECLQRLLDKVENGEESLIDLILSDRLGKLMCIRLEMQAPYISMWPQALSIQAQPVNLPVSFKQRAMLIDEIWHLAGDFSSDTDWYVKRTILGGIYSTAEVYMITDHSPGFRDTWMFLNHRVKDAFDLQKSVQEATSLAEAVGAGVGSSLQGFVKQFLKR